MMLVKFLLILILIYWALRAVRNLARAVLGDPRAAQSRVPPSRNGNAPADPPGWESEAPAAARRRDDVEDAKWVDL